MEFLIADCRLPICGSATPLFKGGQRRLSSINRKPKTKNRQFVADLLWVIGCEALGEQNARYS
jgi:hypothetical protein